MKAFASALWRLVALAVLATLALQLYFFARVALMALVDPQSTTFQRSEAWRLLVEKHQIAWAQRWVDYAQISPNLKRAVIASEDAGFVEHSGVEWEAVLEPEAHDSDPELHLPVTGEDGRQLRRELVDVEP